jgi:hypothetical protein
LLRVQDEVHVVWHQAIGPHFHLRLAHLLAKQIVVNFLIAVFKENRFSTICRAASRGAGDRIPPRGANASRPQSYHERKPGEIGIDALPQVTIELIFDRQER